MSEGSEETLNDIEPRRVQPSAYSTASWGNNKDMVSSDGSTKPLNIATGIR